MPVRRRAAGRNPQTKEGAKTADNLAAVSGPSGSPTWRTGQRTVADQNSGSGGKARPISYGVIQEAIEQLKAEGVSANHLPIKWIVPLNGDAVVEILSRCQRTIIVENNYSGQFYR